MQEIFEKIKERLEENQEITFYFDGRPPKQVISYDTAIEIVNQVAEEYSHVTSCYLQSPCEYQNKDGKLPLLEFADDDGWIPVSERLPEEKVNPVTQNYYVYPVMVQFEEITDIRYYNFGNGHWWHGPGIMDKYVTHWMDIKPYKPKGEK